MFGYETNRQPGKQPDDRCPEDAHGSEFAVSISPTLRQKLLNGKIGGAHHQSRRNEFSRIEGFLRIPSLPYSYEEGSDDGGYDSNPSQDQGQKNRRKPAELI